jgi:hypothetical protein
MTSMSEAAYDHAVRLYLKHFKASVISGPRTTKHSISVGGFKGDPHTCGFGTDVEYDEVPALDQRQLVARAIGLAVLTEGHTNGDHLQPLDWKNDEGGAYA